MWGIFIKKYHTFILAIRSYRLSFDGINNTFANLRRKVEITLSCDGTRKLEHWRSDVFLGFLPYLASPCGFLSHSNSDHVCLAKQLLKVW